MLIIGIDPGCSGAVAVTDMEGNFIAYLIMPLIKVGKQSKVNGAAVKAFINEVVKKLPWSHSSMMHAFIEQVHAMPGQGVTSMFTFGHAAGKIEGVIEGLGIPWTGVTPQAWKKSAGLIGTDKDAARSRAIMLYPNELCLHKKGEGQAIADALLIARHGRINMNGKKADLI